MKRFISIFWIVMCTLSVFQNGSVYAGKCVFCKFGSILTPSNASVTTKLNTDRPKTRPSMTVSVHNLITVKTSLDHHTENELLTTIKSAEDLIKFSSETSLVDLSPEDKESLVIVITSVYGYTIDPLPPAMVVNLVRLFACSPSLFSTISKQCLKAVLSILTINRCALCEVPPKDRVLFLNGLLSLSPSVLNIIPRGSFISILGTVTTTDFFDHLPPPSAVNLITALSMSKSTVSCLPLPTLVSLLTFMAFGSSKNLMTALPPSTVFGFLDGLLDTLDESPTFLVDVIPTPVMVAILSPVMDTHKLGVMPISTFNLLLSVLGSSPELSKCLPLTNFISLFNITTTSPIILSSLNPDIVAKMLSMVTKCPSIMEGLPLVLMDKLLDWITVYLPSSLPYITANEYSLLFGKKN